MGREVKIVSLDFDWYESHNREGDKWAETWKGYLFDYDLVCFLCEEKKVNLKGKDCPLCDGEGKLAPRFEPPKEWDDKKNGYQIWEDVSEGSPVSPVFKNPEDLAKWMVKNDDSITKGTSYEVWLKMIKKVGSAPSMIMVNGGMSSGMSLYEEKELEK